MPYADWVFSVGTLEKPSQHLQTLVGHLRPQAVLSVTVFCDFEMVFRLPPDGSSLISIPVVGFVQSESRTARTMTQWLPDAKWAPVPGCYLCRHPEATENDFEPIWIGAVITTMKERYPGKSVGAAALPVEGGGVVLMDGLTLHSGTDETGLRAFACFTLPVSILFLFLQNVFCTDSAL